MLEIHCIKMLEIKSQHLTWVGPLAEFFSVRFTLRQIIQRIGKQTEMKKVESVWCQMHFDSE